MAFKYYLVQMAALAVVLLACSADAYLPRPEAQRLCRLRTGLSDRDIQDYPTRNKNCAVDCITKSGAILTAHVDDGVACHDQDGFRCVMGECRSIGDKIDDELKDDLYTVDLKINSAHVADRDPYPTQGESDPFVVVELASNGGPSFKDGDVICYTHVIQDTSRPKWNFVCKPLPLKSSAKLRFVVLDSDKPDTNPQLLGSSIQGLDSIMNDGPQTITLDQANFSGGPFWLEVEAKAKKYSPGD